MAFPSLKLSVDTTSNPLDIPSAWTIVPGPRSFTIHQGRQRLRDRTEVGEAGFVVDVRLGQLGGVRPGTHIKLEAIKDGSTFPLFRGFVRARPREWPGEVDAISRVDADDAFALMARYDLEGQAVASLKTGAHLEAVLTAFGWPLAGTIPAGVTWWQLGTVGKSELGTTTRLGQSLRFLETGHSTLMATTLTGNLLDHLLNAAETTEGGTFYIGPSGDVIFEEAPLAHDPIIATFGPNPGELPYISVKMSHDDVELFNDIRLTNRGSGNEHKKVDAASKLRHGPRTLSITDLLFSDEGQVDARADDLLRLHKQTAEYPAQLVLRPKPDGPLWPIILGLKLGSRIRVRHAYGAPLGGYEVGYDGGYGTEVLTFDSLVVGVTYQVDEFWEIIWDLAPISIVPGAWYLGIVGSSELGTNTRLG